MTIYLTLDEALQDIANRSFYEGCTVTPCFAAGEGYPHPIAAYRVEDSANHMDDDWSWTYDNGVEDSDSVSECSRLFDPYESFNSSANIRHYLPEAVEELEYGSSAVAFSYAIVQDLDHVCDYPDQGCDDDIAGWIICANFFPID